MILGLEWDCYVLMQLRRHRKLSHSGQAIPKSKSMNLLESHLWQGELCHMGKAVLAVEGACSMTRAGPPLE